MTQYNVSVDLSGVAASMQALVNEKVFPLVNQAIRAVAQQTRINWINAVQRAHLWSVEKDAYSASITYEMTGPFSAVVQSDYKHAYAIETGRPPKDLKAMLNTSTKVRRTQDGRRFLVIPFRHNTIGQEAIGRPMPPEVHAAAAELSPSTIVAQSQRPSGELTALSPKTGMRPLQDQSPYLSNQKTRSAYMVPRNVYSWGDSLPAGLAPKLRQEHKTDIYAGMKRFDAGAPGQRYSVYMTFRIMMEGQSGWIVPAKPGMYLAKGVADEMTPLAEKVLSEAIKRSVD